MFRWGRQKLPAQPGKLPYPPQRITLGRFFPVVPIYEHGVSLLHDSPVHGSRTETGSSLFRVLLTTPCLILLSSSKVLRFILQMTLSVYGEFNVGRLEIDSTCPHGASEASAEGGDTAPVFCSLAARGRHLQHCHVKRGSLQTVPHVSRWLLILRSDIPATLRRISHQSPVVASLSRSTKRQFDPCVRESVAFCHAHTERLHLIPSRTVTETVE